MDWTSLDLADSNAAIGGGNGGQIVGPCGIVWMQTCPLGENCAPGKPGGKTRRRK